MSNATIVPKPDTLPRSSFTIQINEHQRKLLEAAIFAAAAVPTFSALLRAQPSDNGEDSALADLLIFAEMLVKLPANDATCPPGCVHGFCL